MLQELGAQLSEIVEQKRLKRKLEQDLQSVEAEVKSTSARLSALDAQLAQENMDVRKLEQVSLTALFARVLGSREEQLEKERQDVLSAQLKQGQTKRQLEYLQEEKHSLLRRLDPLAGVDAAYEKLLTEKENLLRQSNSPIVRELIDLSEQLANVNSEQKEITQAISAGNDVILCLEQVLDSLHSAEHWGAWDMFGGGLISTAIKHSRIDDARREVHAVQLKMSQFKRELADGRESIEIEIEVGELASFADFFFDGLIVDWIVQSRIEDSLSRSEHAKESIAHTVKELEQLKTRTENQSAELKGKQDQLIERA